METKSMLTKILTAVAAVSLFVAVGSGSAYAGFISEGPDGVAQVEFSGLVGITPSSFPNFENTVKVRVLKKGNKGYKLKVRKKRW